MAPFRDTEFQMALVNNVWVCVALVNYVLVFMGLVNDALSI
jgi:hypothetical protein